jgi:aldehyde dehydrogenase (NAD+)
MTPEGVNIKHPDKLFIGGEWIKPMSNDSIEVVNPAIEEVVARVAHAGNRDMDAAVAAARHAFDHGPWPSTPPLERMAKLMQFVDALEPRVPELAAAWTAQVGGLASMAGGMHAGGVAGLRGIASLGERFAWVEQRPGMAVDTVTVVREPVGVVVAIAPWNGPFAIMANKVFYALVAGCTVVMKPRRWRRFAACGPPAFPWWSLRASPRGASSPFMRTTSTCSRSVRCRRTTSPRGRHAYS